MIMTKKEHDALVYGLKRVRNLLARPNGWIQKASRRAIYGTGALSYEERFAYCLIGGIETVAHSNALYDMLDGDHESLRRVKVKMMRLTEQCVGTNIPGWNDIAGRTQGEVVEKMDCAVRKARELMADA